MNRLAVLLEVREAFANWPTYVRHYLGLSSEELMTIRLRKYDIRMTSPGRTYEFHALYRLMYELDEYRLRQYRLAAGSTLVDIGAHIGWFSLSALAFVETPRVFSYEPFSFNYSLLKKNIALNAATNHHAFQMAVSDVAGDARFEFDERLGTASTSGTLVRQDLAAPQLDAQRQRPKVGDVDFSVPLEVRCTTLDELIAQNGIETIDLLKVDCEGAEHRIVRTVSEESLRRVKRISVEADELTTGEGVQSMGRLLAERGFSVETGGVWGNVVYGVRS
jgi:FkbM family methyltransferase